ncbi:MAG: L-threonylcarbamoyladenylate synthase [Candidatus Peregrinibacteria bacterium]
MNKININDPEVVAAAVRVLRNGGVVMHPTETCYGFAVDVFNEKALEKLYRLKGRDFDKPVSILVNSFEMAEKYGVFSEKALEIARKYWPGPLSIVVPSEEKSVSIRFSDNGFCNDMVREFGGPVTTTSANVSGNEPLYEPDLSQFGENTDVIDLVVDGGKLERKAPSTVVKIFGENVEILRQGGIRIL